MNIDTHQLRDFQLVLIRDCIGIEEKVLSGKSNSNLECKVVKEHGK